MAVRCSSRSVYTEEPIGGDHPSPDWRLLVQRVEMPGEEQNLRAVLEAFKRELDRMTNEGQIQQAGELVAAICARFVIETARID
jgi:hypothetical protein